MYSHEYFRVALREKKTRNTQGELVVVFSLSLSFSCRPFYPEGVCECSHCEHVLVFPWDQRGLLFLGVPNLLVGDVYHVKNEGCLLEVFIMRLFKQTLSI